MNIGESTVLGFFKKLLTAIKDVARGSHYSLGGNGTYYLDSTTKLSSYGSVQARNIISMDDTTAFTTMTDSEGEDVLSYSGLGANALKSSFLWSAKDGRYIVEAELSAGVAIATKK